MKTTATVDIIKWQHNELTVRIPGNIDKTQMDFYIQHRRDLYRKERQNKYSGGKVYTALPIELLLSDKYKKRSTGKNSQNTKLHGMIRIIANATGNDFEMVKYAVKKKAMNELGYPAAKDSEGNILWNSIFNEPFPQSEADCTTVEESLLIEAAYLLSADLGIFLDNI